MRISTYSYVRNLKPLKNTLFPRVKRFTATISELYPYLDAVYDVTIGYPKKEQPGFFSYFTGDYCGGKVHFHIRRFPISTFTQMDEDQLSDWVYKTWEEKDDLLEYFNLHDKFPGKETEQGFGARKIFQNVRNAFYKSRSFLSGI
jgi:hypothetical protein